MEAKNFFNQLGISPDLTISITEKDPKGKSKKPKKRFLKLSEICLGYAKLYHQSELIKEKAEAKKK